MKTIALAVTALLTASVAHAAIVEVEVAGTVLFNGIDDAPLSGVGGSEQATVTFQVDSETFDEGVPGDTRGYVIDPGTFMLSFSGGVSVGMMDPGDTGYFTLVEGFPVSDGFFVSTSPVSPGGVPLTQDPVNLNLDLGYGEDTLATLDILDAVGSYAFDGLTRYSFTLWVGFPDNAVMELDFESMTIEEVTSTPAEQSSWGELKGSF